MLLSAEFVMEVKAPRAGDMPVIKPKYSCRKHRYDYFLTLRGLSTLFDSITKFDTRV